MPNVVSQSWACLALQQLADVDGLICTAVPSCTSTADRTLLVPGQEPALPLHSRLNWLNFLADCLPEMQAGAAGWGGIPACMHG